MKTETWEYINDFITRYPHAAYLKDAIISAVSLMTDCAKNGKILLCGNGGSAADCEHLAGELLKGFEYKRPISPERKTALLKYGEFGKEIADNLQQGICCIPLVSFSAAATAFANDCNPDFLFAQLVNSIGKRGDALIVFSTSGNSSNAVYAAVAAKAAGMSVIAFTGENGGTLKEYADVLLNVPEKKTYLVQEMHLPVYHLLCHATESELFDE